MKHEIDLVLVTCCECGTVFGVQALMHQRKLVEMGQTFYCPNGHTQTYGEGLMGKLKKQLAQEAKKREIVETRLHETREEVERQERRVSAYKGQVTKTKNKIARGVCPCCDTYFENLHTHMSEAHPDYEQTDEAETGMTVKA